MAGETASNDVNGSDAVSSQSICGEVSDIVITGNPGPVMGKPPAAKFVNLAERDGLKTARALQPQAEAAYYPREKV